jgi:MFS family permease
MRTVLAVVAGYVIFAVSAVALFQLTHRAPHAATSLSFALVATAYGIAFAVLAGSIAQRIARRVDLLAPAGVALVIALGAAVSLMTTWRGAAHWSQWTALVLMAPSSILGGALARRVTPAQ